MNRIADILPEHVLCRIEDCGAALQLDRPNRKSPLTFESHTELHGYFRGLRYSARFVAKEKPVIEGN